MAGAQNQSKVFCAITVSALLLLSGITLNAGPVTAESMTVPSGAITVAKKDDMYHVIARREAAGVKLFLVADTDVKFTYRLSGSTGDFIAQPPLPVVREGKRGQEVEITKFARPWAPGQGPALLHEMKYGWVSVNSASEPVALPFRGGPFSVIQGQNGSFSHFNERQFAVDFAMPEGTQIYAARDGTVVKIIDHFSKTTSGDDDRDQLNLVYLVHDDGTLTAYLHLRHKGVKVREGQKVKAGDLIAESGATGWAKTPHLHFEVFRPDNWSNVRRSLQFQFRLPSGEVVDAPRKGDLLP